MTWNTDETYIEFFTQIVGRFEMELLSDEQILKNFNASKILVVGAGGTIGSSLCSRLVKAGISNVFFLDRDESALHALTLNLSNVSASLSENCFVGDIRDLEGMRNIMRKIRPDIVIHAAALKHLVILERFPREGYLTNVLGTRNLALASREFKVEKFINISTDKAANPTSMLGKTKKIAELITEEVFQNSETKHASVRFGNVFASRGSVIETFVHQIKNDLLVTITDSNARRFFMSRNEAANLVLAAITLEESGTYIQNMGEDVSIIEIVHRLANYYGKAPRIEFFGLQSGEKMTETLFDGAASSTRFSNISRSDHERVVGILNDVESYFPSDDYEAKLIIEDMMCKYMMK